MSATQGRQPHKECSPLVMHIWKNVKHRSVTSILRQRPMVATLCLLQPWYVCADRSHSIWLDWHRSPPVPTHWGGRHCGTRRASSQMPFGAPTSPKILKQTCNISASEVNRALYLMQKERLNPKLTGSLVYFSRSQQDCQVQGLWPCFWPFDLSKSLLL